MNARSLPADGSSSGAAPATPLHTSLRACARALRDHRDEAVRALIAGAQAPKDNRFDDPPEIFKRRVAATLDLLIGHLEGREDFAALYAGQRNYELFQLERSLEDNLQASRRSVAEDGAVLRAVLAPRVDANALAAFEAAYATLTAGLVKQASQHVRTLFIGDCLIGETLSFLVGPLMDEGLSIEPFPINPHDPVQLRQALASLATKRFDVVFFSPFSHARVPELEALMDPARAFMPRAELEDRKSVV